MIYHHKYGLKQATQYKYSVRQAPKHSCLCNINIISFSAKQQKTV